MMTNRRRKKNVHLKYYSGVLTSGYIVSGLALRAGKKSDFFFFVLYGFLPDALITPWILLLDSHIITRLIAMRIHNILKPLYFTLKMYIKFIRESSHYTVIEY